MKPSIFITVFVFLTAIANATLQTKDALILDSKIYTVSSPKSHLRSPFILTSYIKKHDLKMKGSLSTANYKGYKAIWMIRDNKLFLIGLDSSMKEISAPGVKDLPGAVNGELFAE